MKCLNIMIRVRIVATIVKKPMCGFVKIYLLIGGRREVQIKSVVRFFAIVAVPKPVLYLKSVLIVMVLLTPVR